MKGTVNVAGSLNLEQKIKWTLNQEFSVLQTETNYQPYFILHFLNVYLYNILAHVQFKNTFDKL